MKKFGIETDVKLSFSKPKTNFRQVYQKHQRIEMTAMLTSITSALNFLFRNTLPNELLTKKSDFIKNAKQIQWCRYESIGIEFAYFFYL